MRIQGIFCSLLIFGALSLAPKAGATEVLTTSYNGWLTTITGSASEWDFNIPSNTYNTASGYSMSVGSYGPITVTGPDGSGYSLTKNPGYSSSNLIALSGASDGVGTLDFTTPAAGLSAFGLGLGITGNAAPITVTLSDGETFTASPAVDGTVFLGLSSASPITSFVLSTSAGSAIQLTDFLAGASNEQASSPAPAGEVATALMIGTGLLAFGGCRKVFSNVSAARA